MSECLWLPIVALATSILEGDNRNIDVSGIFWGVLLIVSGWELMTIDDPSLSTHGYQLLHLITSQLVGNNKEFHVSDLL